MDENRPFLFTMSPRTAGALDEIRVFTGDTDTDSINRAIQLYASVTHLWNGPAGEILVASPDGGEMIAIIVKS